MSDDSYVLRGVACENVLQHLELLCELNTFTLSLFVLLLPLHTISYSHHLFTPPLHTSHCHVVSAKSSSIHSVYSRSSRHVISPNHRLFTPPRQIISPNPRRKVSPIIIYSLRLFTIVSPRRLAKSLSIHAASPNHLASSKERLLRLVYL